MPRRVAVADSASLCKNPQNGEDADRIPKPPHPRVPMSPAPWVPESPHPCILESLRPSHPRFLADTESHRWVRTGRQGARAGRQAWRVLWGPHAGPAFALLPRHEGRGNVSARPRAAGPAPPAASHPRPCPHFPAAGLPVTRSEGSELQPCDQDPARTEGAGPGPHGSRRHGNSARPCAVTPPQAVPLPLKGMPPGSEAGRNATPRGRPGLGPSLGSRGARNRGREQPQPQGAGSRPGRSCLQRGRGRGHPTLETGREPGLRGASLHLDFVQQKS